MIFPPPSSFSIPPSTVPHTSRHLVRWSDLDALGHLNNAVYLTLCEEARIDVLTALFPAWWTESYSPVVASASLQFRSPITVPGPVLVTVGFDAPGRSSLRMTYTIATEADPNTVCAECDSVLVWVDRATASSRPIPEGLRDALTSASN